jgi:hypothetical protein
MEIGAGHSNNRKIGERVDPAHFGVQFPAIREDGRTASCAGDHMSRRDDETVGTYHNTAPLSRVLPAPARLPIDTEADHGRHEHVNDSRYGAAVGIKHVIVGRAVRWLVALVRAAYEQSFTHARRNISNLSLFP